MFLLALSVLNLLTNRYLAISPFSIAGIQFSRLYLKQEFVSLTFAWDTSARLARAALDAYTAARITMVPMNPVRSSILLPNA